MDEINERLQICEEALNIWETHISKAEERLEQLENSLLQKETEYQILNTNLDFIDTRIEKFENLIQNFEHLSSGRQTAKKLDLLESIKIIQRSIDEHYSTPLTKAQDDPATLSNLLWNLSDLMFRFESLQRK